MYYDYFGLSQPPFKITPDTRLFYPGGDRGTVLEALTYAILNGEGIVKVVGEVGTGKTMLCRMLEKELPDRVEVVYLANPSLSPENTLHAIIFELDLDVAGGASRFEVMNSLQQCLLERHSQNRQVVVFVEEAQSMPLATLEEIRLLSNLETQEHKLLQIVLFGQPELDVMLATPAIRQLKERITYSFRLKPFATDDIRDYLNSRVRACGYRAGSLFDKSAVTEMTRYSAGLLRRINILADKALLAAYAENSHRITGQHIRKAARDSEFVTGTRQWSRPLAWAIAGIIVIGLIGLIIAYLPGGVPPGPAPVTELQAPPGPGENRPQAAGPGPQSGISGSPAAAAEPAGAGADDAVSPAPAATPARQPGPDSSTADPQTNVPVTGAAPTGPPDGDEQDVSVDDVDRLRGFEAILQAPAGGGLQLTGGELDRLRRQLQKLPPETVVVTGSVPAQEDCKHCWSFVYRPLVVTENL